MIHCASRKYVIRCRTSVRWSPPKKVKLCSQVSALSRDIQAIFVSTEVAPWSKAGGLGDVLDALPVALAGRGLAVMTVAPAYEAYPDTKDSGISIPVNMSTTQDWSEGAASDLNGSTASIHSVQIRVRVSKGVLRLFVTHPFFSVPGTDIYSSYTAEGDPRNVPAAMDVLCQAALAASCLVWHNPALLKGWVGGPLLTENQLTKGGKLDIPQSVFVANDWPTGLLPLQLIALQRRQSQKSILHATEKAQPKSTSLALVPTGSPQVAMTHSDAGTEAAVAPDLMAFHQLNQHPEASPDDPVWQHAQSSLQGMLQESLRSAKSIMCVHNIAYQGVFDAASAESHHLPPALVDYLDPSKVELTPPDSIRMEPETAEDHSRQVLSAPEMKTVSSTPQPSAWQEVQVALKQRVIAGEETEADGPEPSIPDTDGSLPSRTLHKGTGVHSSIDVPITPVQSMSSRSPFKARIQGEVDTSQPEQSVNGDQLVLSQTEVLLWWRRWRKGHTPHNSTQSSPQVRTVSLNALALVSWHALLGEQEPSAPIVLHQGISGTPQGSSRPTDAVSRPHVYTSDSDDYSESEGQDVIQAHPDIGGPLWHSSGPFSTVRNVASDAQQPAQNGAAHSERHSASPMPTTGGISQPNQEHRPRESRHGRNGLARACEEDSHQLTLDNANAHTRVSYDSDIATLQTSNGADVSLEDNTSSKMQAATMASTVGSNGRKSTSNNSIPHAHGNNSHLKDERGAAPVGNGAVSSHKTSISDSDLAIASVVLGEQSQQQVLGADTTQGRGQNPRSSAARRMLRNPPVRCTQKPSPQPVQSAEATEAPSAGNIAAGARTQHVVGSSYLQSKPLEVWEALCPRDGPPAAPKDGGKKSKPGPIRKVVNWLLGGLRSAAALVTVSPAYAREIQTDEQQAMGLLPALSDKRIHGIINGINTNTWNPTSDPLLTPRMRYTPSTCAKGKAAAKVWLQARLGLPQDPSVPLVAFVGRLTEQKGVDVLLKALYAAAGPEELAADSLARTIATKGTSMKQPQSQTKRASQRDFQTVIMGTGDQHLENELRYLSRTLPGRGAGSVGFDERFAHRMLAAADILVVPSRFEPCGLVALAALRYGAVPVVASTGGLRDIVSGRFLLGTCPTLDEPLDLPPVPKRPVAHALGYEAGEISISTEAQDTEASVQRLHAALLRAVAEVGTARFRRMQQAGMNSDVSWDAPAASWHEVLLDTAHGDDHTDLEE